MENTVFTIGEALIDFIPKQKGIELKYVTEFERVPGGAPANVAATVGKLGGKTCFISKLGQDAFGDIIIETLNKVGVDTKYVLRTTEANTGLAFVSLREDGERDFSFYRNPSADMILNENEVQNIDFTNNDILHFCSVDLIEAPVKKAHVQAINKVLEVGGLVSFDPNVRLPLWNDAEECRKTIIEFIPKAHILKISDEELEFITEIKDEKEAIQSLFVGNVEAVIYTMGSKGAKFVTRNKEIYVEGFCVDAQDTTGAGDSFIGSLLYQFHKAQVTALNILDFSEDEVKEMLVFSNACAAITTQKKGAIAALPTMQEIQEFIKRRNI